MPPAVYLVTFFAVAILERFAMDLLYREGLIY